MLSGFEDLRASLKERQRLALVQGRGDGRVLAFSHEMFAHADEHRSLFRAMVGKRSGAAVQRMIHKLLLDLVRDDVKALASHDETTSVPTEALVQFVAGSFFGLLMWWLNGKMRLSVEEINSLFRRLALAALKAGPVLDAGGRMPPGTVATGSYLPHGVLPGPIRWSPARYSGSWRTITWFLQQRTL